MYFNILMEIIYILIIFLCVSIGTTIFYILYKSIEYFSEDNKIPKIIIQTWKTKEIPEKNKEMSMSLQKMNSSFEYLFFDDDDIELFLKTNYPQYHTTFTKLPIIIQKIDFFRYIAVYHYGGFYFDLDIEGIEPIDDDILNNNSVFPIDEFIRPYECNNSRFTIFCEKQTDKLLGQYAFAATKNNEFVKLLIDNINNNIDSILINYNNLPDKTNYLQYVYSSTGPDYVTLQYSSYSNKNLIKILDYHKAQCFGKYATHQMHGTWK